MSPPKIGSASWTNLYGSTIASRRGNRAARTMSLATHAAEYCGPMGAAVAAQNSLPVDAGETPQTFTPEPDSSPRSACETPIIAHLVPEYSAGYGAALNPPP